MLNKNIWANFQRIIEFFTQKIVTKLSKIWVWDPGSEIRKKPIPDPGSRGQKGNGSRIRIRNTAKTANSKPVHRFGTGTVQTFRNLILLQRNNSCIYLIFA